MKTAPLTEMMKEFQNGTYNLTKDGKCTGCGACCSNYLPMTDKEIEIIRKYIKVHGIKENKHIFPLSQKTVDATCPFLNDGKGNEKCMIYSVRPEVCRKFTCDSEKREPLAEKHTSQMQIVNVRSEFYHGCSIKRKELSSIER